MCCHERTLLLYDWLYIFDFVIPGRVHVGKNINVLSHFVEIIKNNVKISASMKKVQIYFKELINE